MVPEANKELWALAEAADGGSSASIGAWPLLAQRRFQFLDKQFGINQKIMSESKQVFSIVLAVCYKLGGPVVVMCFYCGIGFIV
jgi:hypothetical protein